MQSIVESNNAAYCRVDYRLYPGLNGVEYYPRGVCMNVYCRVDYRLYPGLADVEYYQVSLSAGDCLYVPYKWSVFVVLLFYYFCTPVCKDLRIIIYYF